MPPYLWRCAGLRGHGGRRVGVCWPRPWAWSPRVPQEAAAEEIEVRAAKHLAFHHFQPVDAPRPGWYSKAG